MINETENISSPDEMRENFQVSEIRYRRRLEAVRDGINNLDVVSQIRYRRLFESARDGILILDSITRKITDANPFMIELLEYTREELLGKELWEIGLLKDEEASRAAFRELQEKGYIRYTDLPLETKAGKRRDVEFISNVYVEDGRRIIQCNIHDITVRKAAENALTKLTGDLELASSEYQRVLNHSLDVICQIDETGKFILVSAAAKKVWGYEPEELIGKMYMELIHPDDRAQTAQAAGDIMSGHPTSTFENCSERKDGSSAYTMWSANWSEPDKTMFCVARDVSPIKQAEKALKEVEANYQSLIESSPAIIYLARPFPPYETIYISPNVAVFGYPPDQWHSTPDMWLKLIHDEDRARVLRAVEEAISQNLDTELEYRITTSSGQILWLQDKGRFILDAQGNTTGWQGVLLDITKTKELEEQLRQSQKLESVGLLAGGIAHDFNNMLTAINGYSDLTLRQLKDYDPLRHNLEEIRKAGTRSASLTHQLLAFSRQQVLQPVVLDLNEVIIDTAKMLTRVIGEDIELVTKLSPKTGRVNVDPGQFSQIIMNLAINARDAMPGGGNLTIETTNIFLDPAYAARHEGFLPGAYVMLAVSDNGTGMNEETQRRLFEPFFTTKEVGKGTGLGLATVYGIVKQSGGNIELDSEQGIGTRFKIYLPRVTGEPRETETPGISEEMPGGTGTILLVEDEELVRNLMLHVLKDCGYQVIEARNGLEALEICERVDFNIDLLLTDIVMPQMSGHELASRITQSSGSIRVLYTSGYTDDAVIRRGILEPGAHFIQKPFSPSALAQKVRDIIDTNR